jgi:hypothetical protein
MSTPGLEEDVTEKFKGAFRHHPAGVALVTGIAPTVPSGSRCRASPR